LAVNSSRIAVIFCFLGLLWAGAPAGLLAHNVSVGGSEEEQHQGAAGTGSGIEAKPAGPVLDAGKDWVEEQTGAVIPLDLSFTDEGGRRMLLRDFIDRPTLLLPIYFYCPSACSRTLADLATSLGRVKATPGKDYRVIALSFNEAETADDARRARNNYLKLVGKAFPENEWRFLTGDRESIAALTTALGYRFKRVGDGTYIHPAALVAVGGDGRIIRYVYGEFISGDVEMAIADAAQGTPSLSVKRLLRMCFSSDPQANTAVVQSVKVAVLAVFAAAIAALLLVFRRRRRRLDDAGDRRR
jgi:protein SCO1/2